jgi:hypothetical protein
VPGDASCTETVARELGCTSEIACDEALRGRRKLLSTKNPARVVIEQTDFDEMST